MEYHTAFDISISGYRAWWFAAIGLIGIAAGAWMVLRPAGDRAPRPAFERWFYRIFLALSIAWTAIAFVGTFGQYRRFTAALESGAAKITIGRVSQFRPQEDVPTGSLPERFCVDEDCFEYSHFRITNAFNQTRMEDGPVREGLLVRVTSYKGAILRLEIADEQEGP